MDTIKVSLQTFSKMADILKGVASEGGSEVVVSARDVDDIDTVLTEAEATGEVRMDIHEYQKMAIAVLGVFAEQREGVRLSDDEMSEISSAGGVDRDDSSDGIRMDLPDFIRMANVIGSMLQQPAYWRVEHPDLDRVSIAYNWRLDSFSMFCNSGVELVEMDLPTAALHGPLEFFAFERSDIRQALAEFSKAEPYPGAIVLMNDSGIALLDGGDLVKVEKNSVKRGKKNTLIELTRDSVPSVDKRPVYWAIADNCHYFIPPEDARRIHDTARMWNDGDGELYLSRENGVFARDGNACWMSPGPLYMPFTRLGFERFRGFTNFDPCLEIKVSAGDEVVREITCGRPIGFSQEGLAYKVRTEEELNFEACDEFEKWARKGSGKTDVWLSLPKRKDRRALGRFLSADNLPSVLLSTDSNGCVFVDGKKVSEEPFGRFAFTGRISGVLLSGLLRQDITELCLDKAHLDDDILCLRGASEHVIGVLPIGREE